MFDSGDLYSEGLVLPAAGDVTQTDLLTPGCFQSVSQDSAVKEVLLMKRHHDLEDQQAGGDLEHQAKMRKYEAFDDNLFQFDFLPSPDVIDPPPTPLPLQAYQVTSQQFEPQCGPSTVQEQASATSVVKMSLFHWQIQRELRKVEQLPPELLCAQDVDGDTFLHIAVAQGKRALAYVLAAKMARLGYLDIKERNNQTAFQVAVASDQHLMVLDLLKHGALLNTCDVWGRTPLHVCAEKGHFLSLQSVHKFLTESGLAVDLEAFSYDGRTALHAATFSHNAVVKEIRSLCPYKCPDLEQRKQAYAECIHTLLTMGASCGTRDQKSGRTCLHVASEEANLELLSVFLHRSVSHSFVNAAMFNGNTALHIVCALQNPEGQIAAAVKLLLKAGADPEIRNLDNELPLQLVPAGSAGEKVRKILKRNCVKV